MGHIRCTHIYICERVRECVSYRYIEKKVRGMPDIYTVAGQQWDGVNDSLLGISPSSSLIERNLPPVVTISSDDTHLDSAHGEGHGCL